MPWGTPDRTLHGEDLLPSTTTVCSRVFKKAAVQSNKGPCMPTNRSFPNKRSWGTVSKAFEKSRIAKSVWILRCLASSRSWSVRSNWGSQEYFARKPWFSGVKIPYCPKCAKEFTNYMFKNFAWYASEGNRTVILRHTSGAPLEDWGHKRTNALVHTDGRVLVAELCL